VPFLVICGGWDGATFGNSRASKVLLLPSRKKIFVASVIESLIVEKSGDFHASKMLLLLLNFLVGEYNRVTGLLRKVAIFMRLGCCCCCPNFLVGKYNRVTCS